MSAKETSSIPVQQPPERPAVLDLIGNTPLVPVHRLDTGPCQLFLKLESQNPGGSIKDRIGLSMIEAAERDGLLPPGGTVVEATAGNTGLGLALVARAKGYRVVLVVPDKMSAEKVLQLMKSFGVDDTAMTFEQTQKLYKEESPIWLEAVTSLGLAPS